MKSIKQQLIDKEMNFGDACTDCYNELTEEDFDYIAEKHPIAAAEFLNQHPFFTKEHVDIIVEKHPWIAAYHLNQHPFLTQKHVDFIVENYPWAAAKHLNSHPLFTKEYVDIIVEKHPWAVVQYLSHRLSEENIAYIANNYPELLKEVFR